MATVAMTIEEVMFKIAMRKIMQRIGIYTATTTVPLVGQAIMLGLLTYDLYQIVKYYNNNKDKIDASFSATIENQYSLLKSEWAKVQQLQQANSTGGNLPPDDDLIKKIIDFCEKVGNFVKNSISGELTTTEKEMIEAEINEFTTKTLGGFLSKFNKVLFPFVLPFVFPTQADASENNPSQNEKAQEKFHSAGDCECTPKDPIIFDLNNDGILETTDINNGIYFDHENDGFAESSAWVGDNDGVLVIDNNNNGKIDNGSELLTAETLANFDTNEDGIIDENDTNFANLKILKGDGTLMTLAEAGITSINLNTTSTEITDENGNQQFASGTFTRADGTTGTFGEFLVNTETSNSIATEWLEETDEIAELPDISGSGNIYSLHQAMLRDESGDLKELIEDFVSETDDSIRQSLVDQILVKWTEVGTIDTSSRGIYVNAQHLSVLEAFMGRMFTSSIIPQEQASCSCGSTCYCGETHTPNPNQGNILENAYLQLKTNIYAELMSQTHNATLLDDIEIGFDTEKQIFTFNLDTITTKLQQAIAENAETGKALAVQFVTTLKGLGLDSYSNYFDPFDDNCLYTALTKNDRELKWQFDTIGKISIEDKTGEGEGSGADDIFRGEQDEDSHFHALTGDDTIYGENGNDSFYACNGDDFIDGGDGDDEIFAGEGNDIVFGGAGNDQLYGAWGDDIIFGGDGDDTIYPDQVDNVSGYGAGEGNDIIRGDKGNDTIYSDLGDDTFIFNLGDGQDTVYEKQGVDTFYFGNGISWSDLTFEQSGDDMIIKINNTTDQITVKDWFLTTGENYKYDNNKIEIFEFADGSKHYKDEITVGDNTDAIVYNMSDLDSDYIETANDYKTTVNLKSGWNHIVAGENSNDTYVFTEQGTDALIVNYSGNNTIKFGNGITLENTVFERNADGLNISFNDFDGHISIEGDAETFANFEFADGTVITDIKNYLRSDIAETDYEMGPNTEELTLVGYEDISATGNDLDNTIRGNEGNTTFEGKGGNDYLESLNGGDDTYIFNLGDGYDNINDCGGIDTIKFGEGITPENIVMLKNLSNNNLEIWFDVEDGGGITIENYFSGDENKIERFEFSDGTVVTDITPYIKAYGSDEDITLPEGILQAHLRGNENTTAIGNNLGNWFSGNSGDNKFVGGEGDDSYWDDQGGSDRFIYNIGDGHDFIENIGGLDAVVFGEAITKENILFSQDENNLIISFVDNENDSICIANYFAGDENKIELFRFSNGDVISDISAYLQNEEGEVAQIVADGSIVMLDSEETATLSGTNNATVLGNNTDNTIVGNSGNNTYYAGGGDDTITDVLGGNDTYIYKLGNGNDTITDVGGIDTLRFEGEIFPENTKFEQIDNNLVISFYDVEGSVTISDYFLNDDHKIENIVFANGETITSVENLLSGIVTNTNYTFAEETIVDTVRVTGNGNVSVVGNSSDNTFVSNAGANTFEGKSGDDNFIDEQGGDTTYIYNLGDGFDFIKDAGGSDTIKFGEGITLDNLAFKQTATDLEIWFHDEDGGLIIENFFSNPENKIEKFELADGTVITDITNYITAIGSDENIVLPEGVSQAHLSGNENTSATGNSLDNWFSGNSGNNTFEGKGGNDYFYDDQGGDETYIYNIGDGYDTINDNGGFDTIKFGAGITKENLVFIRQTNGNLIINLKDENGNYLDGNICIEDYFNDENKKIERIEFADGSSIVNFESKVTILAGEGDISNWYNLKEIQVWSDGDCNVYGSQKDEVIFGGAGNNTYDTYDGTDYIYDTQGGNDEYIFGDNSDIKYILDIGGEDTIKIGSFTSFEETMFVQNGNNLRIYFKNKLGKFIQIEDYFVDDEHKIEKCEFADGTVITDLSNYITGYAKEEDITLSGNNKSAILLGKDDLSVIGSSNDDYIRGNSGDNTYTGGAGDDTIEDRAGGNDTYVYNWGDGNDCIMDIGGEDTVKFGENITLENLSFENYYGDLKIEIQNEDGYYGSIFVVNHFKSEYRKIEHIELADGTIINDLTPYLTGTTVKTDYTISEDSPMKKIYLQGKKNISVVGNSSDNNFSGNSGNNTFEGKGGNDSFWDEAGGDDTYIYNLGDGFDYVHDKSGNDTIQFGEGISENDIKFVKNANSLEIRVGSDENYGNIFVDNYFDSSNDYKIENIKFADGTTITDVNGKLYGFFSGTENIVMEATMVEGGIWGDENLNVTGNNLDNLISGNAGNNTFEGKQGNDNFYDDQGGNDTYIYNIGDGFDYITDIGGNDTIKLGEGITASMLTMNRWDDGQLEITFDGVEGNIVIDNYFNNDENKIEKIILNDGTEITDFTPYFSFVETDTNYTATENGKIQNIIAIGSANTSLIGNSDNNTISGNSGNNTFDGKGGDDRLVDNQGGNDTYIYNLGDGNDTINDIGGIDTIKFGAGITLENIAFMQTSSSLNIWFHNQDGEIIIEDYFSNPDNKIERFELADGTVITDISNYITAIGSDESIVLPEGVSQAHLWGDGNTSATGNSLDNWFGGNSGNNTFEGKGGNDYFCDDQGGDDTYIYNLGDGYDWISDTNGNDSIRLGQGITTSILRMAKAEGGHLEIKFDGYEGNIVIENYFNNDENKIEKIILNDGTEITDFTPYFTFVETDTNYTIAENNNVIEEIIATGDENISLTGNSNNNFIYGNSGNNTFEGKGGDDRLVDNQGGNDTYIYNLGDGNDTINDIGGIDTIKFGAGITLENLAFMQTSSSLNIWFHNQDGEIIIEDYFSNPDNKIERFELADGTVITDISNYITAIGSDESIVLPDGVLQAHLWGDGNTSATGNSLDNWFGGNSGNNTFEGKGGDDYFCDDQGGDDTYIYNLGDGYDWISDTNGNDTIQFGTGITANNVSFNQTAEGNLEITFGEEEGSIVIEDYFNVHDDKKIENFAFSDGTTLSDISSLIIPYAETNSEEEYVDENTINGIIQEMSTYAPDGEMAIGEYNQNSEELLQLVAC